MTISQLQHGLVERLTPMYGEREARWLTRVALEFYSGHDRVWLLTHADTPAGEYLERHAADVEARLLRHEPIQYITGEAAFCGMTLHVTPATLIPRPETAELVDLITDDYADSTDLRVLDACTGSGCIAIALARALKFAKVRGVDISQAAIEVARQNAIELRSGRSTDFAVEDILTAAWPQQAYDIVVSNPPYIAESERASMEANVLDYEPAAALFVPDADPLLFYRAIAAGAATALRHGGGLYFEINPLYADATAACVAQAGFADVTVLPDAQGRRRFIKARRP